MQGCGGIIDATNEWKNLKPPLDLITQKYYGNLRCNWNIKATESQKIIEIRLNVINMEEKKKMNFNTTTINEFNNNNDNFLKEFESFEANNCYDFITVM